jgi:ribosomal protein L7/L12
MEIELKRAVCWPVSAEEVRMTAIARDELTLKERPITRWALDLLVQDQKVRAVKRQRDDTGDTLLEAKRTVDAMERTLNRFVKQATVCCATCLGKGVVSVATIGTLTY